MWNSLNRSNGISFFVEDARVLSDLNQFLCNKWNQNLSREILSTELLDTVILREIIWPWLSGKDILKFNER